MTWRNKNLSSYAKYDVEITTTKVEESSLLKYRGQKSPIYNVFNKMAASLVILMLLVVGFTGLMANSKPAQAWGPFDDALENAQNAFCASSPYGYKAENIETLKPKKAKNATNQTAYEKYGMYGTQWSVWSGFVPEEGGKITGKDNNNGVASTRGIINLVGGDSKDAKMNEWEEQFKGNESKYPGMFNFAGECGGISLRMGQSWGANLTFSAAKSITWASSYVYQLAGDVNETIYDNLEKPVTKIVQALKTNLYLQYLTPMIMVAALWMGWVGLVKRESTKVFGGLIWVIGAIAASVAMMTNPMALPKLANETIIAVSQNIMTGMTSANSGQTDLCKATGKDKSSNAVRNVQCNLWYSFVYTPFVYGQFGKSPNDMAKETGENSFLATVNRKDTTAVKTNGIALTRLADVGGQKHSFERVKFNNHKQNVPDTSQSWALAWIDFKANWDNGNPDAIYNKHRALISISANQLAVPHYNADFRGDNGNNRNVMAMMALVASLGSGIMIIILSGTLIILDLQIILLAMVSPAFCMAALHPGAGRRIAMGWVEALVKLCIQRILGSLFLGAIIMAFSVLIDAESDWIMSIVLIICLSIAGIVYFKKLNGMLTQFSMGGQSFDMPGERAGNNLMDKMGRGFKGNTAALLTGGLGGRSSMLGQAIAGNRAEKRWDKRMAERGASTGAGRAPQSAGAGAQPQSRKEKRKAEQYEAFKRTKEQLGTKEETPTQEEFEAGAGAQPQVVNQPNYEEIDNSGAGANTQGYRTEMDGQEALFEMDTSGAGKAPNTQELPVLPPHPSEMEGQEALFELDKSGAGKAPQSEENIIPANNSSQLPAPAGSYREALQKHPQYGKPVQRGKIATALGNNKAVVKSKQLTALGANYVADKTVKPVVSGVKSGANTLVSGVKSGANTLGSNIKSVTGNQIQFGKDYLQAKSAIRSENQYQKRVADVHRKLVNEPGTSNHGQRAKAEAIVQQQQAEAQARRQALMAPVQKVTRASATAVTNTVNSGVQATQARLAQGAQHVRNRTVVAYEENKAVKQLNKLNHREIVAEQRVAKESWKQERKEMKQDIKSVPRSFRESYAKDTYGATKRGKAIEGDPRASNAAKPFLPPISRPSAPEPTTKAPSGNSQPKVTQPKVNPPKVTQPQVTQPKVNPPKVNPPKVTKLDPPSSEARPKATPPRPTPDSRTRKPDLPKPRNSNGRKPQ